MNDKHLSPVTAHITEQSSISPKLTLFPSSPYPTTPHFNKLRVQQHNTTVSPSVPVNVRSGQSTTNPANQYPQVIYLPQEPTPSQPEPATVRQTCHEVVTRSVVHIWYLVYVCIFAMLIYTYRLPAWNENLKLQIELAKVRMQEEEFRSRARIREAEIHRDLTLDVEKLKEANEHDRKMESLRISKALAEKFLDSNMEVKEKSSGFFSKEKTTMKRTFLEPSDTEAFAKLLAGYSVWGSVEEHVNRKLLTHIPNSNRSIVEQEEDELEIFDEL